MGAVSGHDLHLRRRVPGAYLPDLEQAGCILFWGYNPNLARLSPRHGHGGGGQTRGA